MLYKLLYKIKQGYLELKISNEEIEMFADDLAKNNGRDINNPYFDIDEFIEFELGLPLLYKKLSANSKNLGMTILVPGNVRVFEDNVEKYENFDTIGTIIIDAEACESENRERFTKAHELGHYYFDLPRYSNTNNNELINNIECEIDEKNNLNDISWEERRANKFASCILMPRCIFKYDFENYLERIFNITRKISSYKKGVNLNYMISDDREKTFDYFCKRYGVSRDALINRLISFNYIDRVLYNCPEIRNNKKFEF